jgi:hypothetical protein
MKQFWMRVWFCAMVGGISGLAQAGASRCAWPGVAVPLPKPMVGFGTFAVLKPNKLVLVDCRPVKRNGNTYGVILAQGSMEGLSLEFGADGRWETRFRSADSSTYLEVDPEHRGLCLSSAGPVCEWQIKLEEGSEEEQPFDWNVRLTFFDQRGTEGLGFIMIKTPPELFPIF